MGRYNKPRVCDCGKQYNGTGGWNKHKKTCKLLFTNNLGA